MKRILIFTCMVFVAVSVCFAAELTADGYNRTDNTMAQTVVTLTMDGTSDTNQEVIQLYFTSADPSEATTPPTATGSVSLGFNGDTIADNSDNSLYVWWKIVSGGNYDIQLGIDAPLVNTKDNATGQEIDWSASWTKWRRASARRSRFPMLPPRGCEARAGSFSCGAGGAPGFSARRSGFSRRLLRSPS